MNLQNPIGFLLFSLLFSCKPEVATGQLTDTSRVAIHDLGEYYELENGFLGVRIPRSVLFKDYGPEKAPAPFRCVVYSDGWQSNDYENYLESRTLATSMSDEVLYETEDSCSIRVSYTFDKPALYGGSGLLEPAGPGYYRVTFKMLKGEKACVITEESDYEVGYRVKISDGIFPDKARYIGHHSTSIANGYDPEGNIYDRGTNPTWHATVDLDFTEQKDFEPLARWNPFVVNSGWHWQVYDSQGQDINNTMGIFDGRTSLLQGASASGAGLYIEPSALRTINASCDESGNCHLLWTAENAIYYKKMNVDGSSDPEIFVAKNYINPFIFSSGNSIHIFAIDPNAPQGGEIRLMTKTGNDPFSYLAPVIDATIEDPFLYGASTADHDFLIFEGERNGESGLLLYVADHNTTSFAFADILPSGSASRGANRPDIKKLPSGDIHLTYTENEFYQSFAVIPAGSTTFTPVDQLPLGQSVTFGMGIDPGSGDFFYVDQGGVVHIVKLSGTTIEEIISGNISAPLNYVDYDEPNHRSIAIDNDGNALIYHEHTYFYYRQNDQTWMTLNGPEWQTVIPAHVHYNTSAGKFIILGKEDGKLVRYTYSGTGLPVLEEVYGTTERQLTGVKVQHKRQSVTGEYYPDIRFQWCLFADKLGNLPPPDQVQPIGTTMNRISGLALKVDDYEQAPIDFSTEFEEGHLYMSSGKVAALIEKVRTDDDFYTKLAATDPFYAEVLDAWRDPTGSETAKVYDKILLTRDEIRDALINGDGIYDFGYMYSSGANRMRRLSDKIAGLLADDQLEVAQRDTLKKCVALFARILWDDDFVPFFEGHGFSFGTPNTPQAYFGQRWFFALAAGDDPEFVDRKALIPSQMQRILKAQVNGAGATIGTPHYLQPPMDLLVFTALQMKNEGSYNKFTSSDTLRYFADFLLHLQTPPSVRFSQHRKLISIGDGNEESAAIFGLLANGFAASDPLLSGRLMNAYVNGPPRGSDFGFITLAIDFDLPVEEDFQMRSGHFPGYLSQLRTGYGTPYESALWLVNGEWYSDHRNDDRGGVSIYALGAPLSLSFGSFYTPHIPGAHFKSALVPVSLFPQWNQQGHPFQLPGNETWSNSDHQVYLAFKNGGYIRSNFQGEGTWTREVYQIHPRKDLPVFIIRDNLTDTSQEFLWNLNGMSEGAVGTVAGPVTPPHATWNHISGPMEQPGAGQEVQLSTGFNRFDFTGQQWNVHPHGGIDWEIYLSSPEPDAATLSSFSHVFIPTVEQVEFQNTNGVPFEERQSILRAKGKSGFTAIILPYYKAQRPQNLEVQQSGDIISISADDFLFETDLNFALIKSGNKQLIQTFTGQHFEFDSISIAGGPVEFELAGDTAYLRVHGDTGTRRIRLPSGNWQPAFPSEAMHFNENDQHWEIYYQDQHEIVNSFEGTYLEYLFIRNGVVGTEKDHAGSEHPLEVFPNPAGKKITIKFHAYGNSMANVKLYSESGRLVMQKKLQAVAGRNEPVLDVSQLTAGLYLLHLEINGQDQSMLFRKN